MAKHLPGVRLVAVVGGSGAGKSWLIDRLLAFYGAGATRIQLDDFYRDRSHLPLGRRPYLNFDAPAAIDWPAARRVLASCRAGRQPALPRYDFVSLGVSRRRGAFRPLRRERLQPRALTGRARPAPVAERSWTGESPRTYKRVDS